jgi:hypothetical protein
MAEKILNCAAASGLDERVIRNGYDKAAEQYSWASERSRLLSVLNSTSLT